MKPKAAAEDAAAPDRGSETEIAPAKQRIIDASYQCFQRFGIRKTTIDDITSAAGVARPTFYTYFSGKDDVVDYVRTLEFHRVNKEIRARMKKHESFADALTECLVILVSVAKDNMHVRALIEDIDSVSKAAQPHSERNRIHFERWSPLLQRAAARGELMAHLSFEEIVSWLILVQQLLLVKVDSDPLSKADLRRFIRSFIVRPLLSERHQIDI